MKTQEKIVKVYYGLKWVDFKPITKEKYHRLKESGILKYTAFSINNPKQQFSIRKRK